MRVTENFTLDEFQSKDGALMPDDVLENIIELAENLQILRDYLKAPIRINSAYRSPEHNKSVGGASRSKHLLGQAADITSDGYTPKQVHETIEKLIKDGSIKQGGLGSYNTFTHYDIRGTKARW